MNQLRPPALRGDDPLGFLAAVGLVALAEQMPDVLGPIRLGWEGARAPKAVLESTSSSLDDLKERLDRAFDAAQANGAVLPGIGPHFPVKKMGTHGGDPMRMDEKTASSRRQRALDDYLGGERWLSRWVSAFVAPFAMHEKGFLEMTAFSAPVGQMTLRGVFDQAVSFVSRSGGPSDALTGWRRAEDYQGANLDSRAVRTAEFRTDGQPQPYGAPSPTWLALMGVRLFPITDQGRRARTTAWLPVALYRGYTRRSLVWPIWEPPLDSPAIRVLLSDPILNATARGREEVERRLRESASRLRALGVTSVFGASRRTADHGDGPLGPAVMLWTGG